MAVVYPTACPVAALALEADEALKLAERFELSDPDAADMQQDRAEALATAAGHIQAHSLLGALYQVGILAGELDEQEAWVGGSEAKRAVRRLSRLARSIALVLADQVERSAVPTVRGYYPLQLRSAA